jgi:hypothetical protein
MSHPIRNLSLKASAFMVFGMILMQNSCIKQANEESTYISREDFIDKLAGDWIVHGIQREQDLVGGNTILIWLSGDSVLYRSSPDYIDHYYHTDDSLFCTLPYIQNFRKWTITENNNDLILKTKDYCGDSTNYNINIDSCFYNKDMWVSGTWGPYLLPAKSWIFAQLNLVNPDTTIIFYEFILQGTGPDANISCTIVENNYWNNFILSRP